jgi:hypothetical protein
MSTQPTPNDSLVSTTTDKKFNQAKRIYAIARRFTDATGVLEDLCSAVCDRNYSRAKLLQDVAFVKKFVISLLKDSIGTITTAARILSPIAGVKYVHERNENKRKQEVAMSKSPSLSLQKEMIVRHVTDGRNNNKHDTDTPPAKRYHRSRACVSPTYTDDSINLPTPESGTAYNKIEVVNILSKVPVGDIHSRAATVKAILAHQKKYNFSCSQASIYRLLAIHAKGVIVSGEFSGKGQPPICSDTDMKHIAQSLDEEVGKTYDKSDVKMIIKKIHTEKLEKAGYKNIIETSICDSTPRNYSALLANEGNIAISQLYTSKSNTCYAAENSIRGSIATLRVVAPTHFITVDEEDADIHAEMKSMRAPSRKLYDMVTDFFGASVYPVEPYLLYLTDDTTEYIFEGTQKKFVPNVLTTKSSISKRGTNAVYKCEGNKSMSGMRVNLTFTFSAMGTCFPLVCTVTGLTEREMPTGEKFLHVKVPGLCIGSGGVNVNNQEVGHLLFMRNTEGAKKKRFKWYQQEILMPGITNHQKWFAKFDGCTLNSIPDKLTAVTYWDGDFSQINAIKSLINLFTNNKVIANKQHASWSGVEQPADLARVFKLIKNMLPSHMVKNIPAERCPMKALMLDAFKDKLEHLNLAPNKRNSLVDFISSLSVIATKACTVKNIQHGIIEAGMIGAENLRYPVFDKIIATCR